MCFFVCRELEREKVWSRIHLVPLLMAEGDRDLYRREQAAIAREKEIMKNVPGWEVCLLLLLVIDCDLPKLLFGHRLARVCITALDTKRQISLCCDGSLLRSPVVDVHC